MDHTQRRGLVAQTAVLNRLVQLGFELLFPYDSALGYELAYFVTEEHRNFGFFLHKESFLVRVQCKSAWLSKDGAYMEFNTHMSSSKKRRGEKRGYAGKAEYFGVFCPERGKVYMVSVDIAALPILEQSSHGSEPVMVLVEFPESRSLLQNPSAAPGSDP